MIAALGLLACEERLHEEAHRGDVAPAYEDAAAAVKLVSPTLPLICGPVAEGVTPTVQLCVDDETGCNYFVGAGYGFTPRIGADGQHFGCRDLPPDVTTVGDAGRETVVYLEPTR